uniref:Uncharacterized protein n=1 Tax=Ascaris lumbricoides TaxID=6252 RepID=A0A9J2PSP4_ASCLU
MEIPAIRKIRPVGPVRVQSGRLEAAYHAVDCCLCYYRSKLMQCQDQVTMLSYFADGALRSVSNCYSYLIAIGSVVTSTILSTVVLLQCAKKKKTDDLVTPSMRTIATPVVPAAGAGAAVAPALGTAPEKPIVVAQKTSDKPGSSPKSSAAEKNEKKEAGDVKSAPNDDGADDKRKNGADKKEEEEEGYEACPELTPEQLLKIAEATPNK